MEQNSDDGADKVEASKGSVEQTPNSPESGAWSRGQVLEAVLNVQMDFDVSKKQWDKNKEDLLEKIGSGQSGPEDVNSQMQLAQLKEESQYKELLLHWRGLQELSIKIYRRRQCNSRNHIINRRPECR